MDSRCGWIIVVFSEDNSVEVVPHTWLNKGTCAWPKAKQAKKIVEKRIKPNKIDFNFYNARQLGTKTYSLLAEARLKLPKAVLKSDLSSAEDNNCDKRQKTLKHYNDSFSPNTNKLKKNNHNHFKKNISNMCPPRYVSKDGTHVIKGSNTSDDSDNNTPWEVTKKSHFENDKDVTGNNIQNTPKSTISTPDILYSPVGNWKVTPTDIGKVSQSICATALSEDIEPKVYTSSTNNKSSTSIAVKRKLFYEDNYSRKITGHDNKENSTNEDILTAIKDFKSVMLTSHAYMKHELQAMMYLCQTTNENVEKLMKEKSSFIPVQNDDVGMEMFPITDEHGLKILEEQMKDSSFRTSMIRKISLLIGNKDLGNSVRRIMSRMFDDKFLTNYSLFGFKKKKSFSCLSCCRLIIASKSRSSSPEREVEPPKFETVPVTRQPKKTYNTSVAGVSMANAHVHRNVGFDTDSDDDMATKCDDFDRHAMGIDDDLRSVHYVEATALTTLAANSTSVAILGTTAKCNSAGVSSTIQRQRSSSSSLSTVSLPSLSQTSLESQNSNTTPVRERASNVRTLKAVGSTSNEIQDVWLSEAEWAKHLATKINKKPGPLLITESVSPPSSPSPFLTSSNRWPITCSSKKSNLNRIPVGVIEVLDCEPVDQWRPPPTKAQRFVKAQRSTNDRNIPLPVIHAMEMKPNSLGHEDMFKTMMVQPPSSDRHGYRARMATGSSTFDSSSRKPFFRQSNESKFRFTEDDYSAATEWMIHMPVFEKCPPAKSKSLPSRDSIPSGTSTAEVDKQHGVLRGSSLPNDNSEAEPTKRHDENVAVVVECHSVVPDALEKPDAFKKSVMSDKPDDKQKMDVAVVSEKTAQSNVSDDQPNDPTNIPDKNKEPVDHVQSDLDAKKELKNTPSVDKKDENDVEKNLMKQEYEGADTNDPKDTKDKEPELDSEYRLTMIHSVREAVNRICEQAVKKTAAIVRNRGTNKRNSRSTLTSSLNDRDESEAADNASSEFSLPPPPHQNPLDSGPQGQESSWPPPPSLTEAEEERTAPGYSFDLPDPPTEMDQMDSETDKFDISDEEMKATGLPSDDDEIPDAIAGDSETENNLPGNEINAAMKTTANGGSSDGSVEAAMAVAQDNGADDRAATTIQAVYRGFRARKYVEAVNAAAVKIQAGFRGYRVRQSLKNAAPSTATTTTDESQCWSDDDQKSVVSVTYTPLKEPRGAGDGRGDGDDDSDDGGDGPISGVGTSDNVSSIPGDIGGGEGDSGGGNDGVDSVSRSAGVGAIVGAHVGAGVGISGVGAGVGVIGVGAYEVDDDDDDQLQTGDDEVFERDDNEMGGGSSVGNPATNPTTTLSVPANLTEVSTQDDAAEEEALVQAAIKIQARVRGFAVRKRLNEENNDDAEKK